ncbi:AAA family ATPase [Streptomyces sp. A108]|nr:AAA family ATPase [Streptomyces sp. A108]
MPATACSLGGVDERTAGENAEPEDREPIVGRTAESARLLRTAGRDPAGPGPADPVLLLVGEAGTGKSTLLDSVARRVAAGGTRVLRAAGSESESDLAFSALHQLLRPVRARAQALPDGQRAALRDALGAGPAAPPPGPPGTVLLGAAVLNLLSALGEDGPVLLVLDDAQWLDHASLDILSFVAGRLAGEPVAVLMGARPDDRLPGPHRRVPVVELGPLDDVSANRLLDIQPHRTAGRTRARILDQAGGNPLALVELARSAGWARETGTELPPAGPLPLADHLERLFAARVATLPAQTARALLLLAAMDTVDSALAVRAGLPGPGDGTWRPAELAGLVLPGYPGVRFRHPLVRSAVYHAASPDQRGQAHLELAGLLHDEPDRRAWHRAAATVRADAAVSADLTRTAERARRRGGHAAAAKALQRAAELAPRRADGARLLVEAAAAAVLTGDLAWVEELVAAARARTDDPGLLADAAVQAGRLAVLTARHSALFSRLTDTAEEAARSRPAAALGLLSDAAVVRFYSGRESQLRRIEDLLRILPEEVPGASWARTWTKVVSNPFGGRTGLVRLLSRAAAESAGRPEHLTALGVMAWLLDETPRAVRAFDEAFDRWQARGALPQGLGGAAARAYLEQGRWDRARESCARVTAVGSALGIDHAVACAMSTEAMLLALQGDTAAARDRAADALGLVDPLESRSVSVFVHRALGAAATAEGAYETAYDRLRAVFTADGSPVHYHASYPALADLAAAAVRAGRREEAAAIVARSAHELAGDASPRLRALIDRARGLLADAADAEPHFRTALADPALAHWPFERAQTLLDLAEWLRRRRRIAEARAPLAEALETFRRLGARPWTERTLAESRAAGLDVAEAAPDALASLSPQQRQIIGLAARGLTNREIGERLFLSPRTVGSHLYRSFPKLGVTTRSQLRDLVGHP